MTLHNAPVKGRNEPMTSNSDVSDLLELLDYLADALELCAAGYLGATRTECRNADWLWKDRFQHWTDPEGERLALWLNECLSADTDRDSVRAATMARGARHAHRIAMHRLMQTFNLEWPPGGLLLTFPSDGGKGPEGSFVDIAPRSVMGVTITRLDENGVRQVISQTIYGPGSEKPRV